MPRLATSHFTGSFRLLISFTMEPGRVADWIRFARSLDYRHTMESPIRLDTIRRIRLIIDSRRRHADAYQYSSMLRCFGPGFFFFDAAD